MSVDALLMSTEYEDDGARDVQAGGAVESPGWYSLPGTVGAVYSG